LAGQHTQQEASRSAGIAAVDDVRWLRQTFEPVRVDEVVAGAFSCDLCPEQANRLDGVETVLAFQVAADLGAPVSEGAEQRSAMRDGLVARHFDTPGEAADRRDSYLHDSRSRARLMRSNSPSIAGTSPLPTRRSRSSRVRRNVASASPRASRFSWKIRRRTLGLTARNAGGSRIRRRRRR